MESFTERSFAHRRRAELNHQERLSRKERHGGWPKKVLGASLAAAAGTLLVSSLPFASGSVTAKKPESPLKKGLAYYQGKTIQFLLDSGVGSGFDIQYRVVLTQMANYLHANVEMVDNPAGAGISAQDAIAAAPKNGLFFGLLNISGYFFDQITSSPSVNFNPEKEDWIGYHHNGATVMYTQSNSPYQTIQQLQGATATNPVKAIELAGLASILGNLTFRTFGIHASYVLGYSSSTAEVTGFLRGDGQLYAGSISSLLSQVQAHTATPVVVYQFGTTLKPYVTPGFTTLQSAPTIQQLIKKIPPKTPLEKRSAALLMAVDNFPQNVIALPSRTPVDMVDALTAAYFYAMSTPAVKSIFQAAGDVPKILTGAQVLTEYKAGIKAEKGIQAVLGITP